jgi:hypothetical protein
MMVSLNVAKLLVMKRVRRLATAGCVVRINREEVR